MINYCEINKFDLNLSDTCTKQVQMYMSKKHITCIKKV